MKRIIALITALFLLLTLAACGAPSQKDAPEQTQTRTELTPEPATEPKTEEPADPPQTVESQPEPQAEESQPDPEDLPPDFELVDQYGNTHRLSDYRGKVVFLNFWATWCPPCRREMPEIQALYEKGLEDLVILSVAAPNYNGEQDEEGVMAFLDETGCTYPVLMDEGGVVTTTYAVSINPTTFLFARDGTIYGYIPGAMPAETMQKAVDQALAN